MLEYILYFIFNAERIRIYSKMHSIQFNLSKAKEKVVCRLVCAAQMNAKTLASLRFIFYCVVDCDSGHLAVWQPMSCLNLVVIRNKKEKVLLWHCKGRPNKWENGNIYSSNERNSRFTAYSGSTFESIKEMLSFVRPRGLINNHEN